MHDKRKKYDRLVPVRVALPVKKTSYKEQIFAKSDTTSIPKCTEPDCDGVVKPDIFFGESLPMKFVQHIKDLKECDLLIILGTSALVVQPFASLSSRVKDNTPRLYINLEKSEGTQMDLIMAMFMGGQTFAFDSEDNIRDMFWQDTCDDGCYALADLLGWGDELREMLKTQHDLLESKEADSKSDAKKAAAL